MKILAFINDAENITIRTALREGQTIFVAKDVCDALDIKNSRAALTDLDDDEKGVVNADSLSNVVNSDIRIPNRGLQYVTESGLYSLIFTSRKPQARAFRKWVTNIVLPSIRRTGTFSLVGKMPLESIRIKQLELQLRAARLREEAACCAIESDLIFILEGGVPVSQWLKQHRPELNPKQRANMIRTIKRWGESQKLPQGQMRIRGSWQTTMLPTDIEAYFKHLGSLH